MISREEVVLIFVSVSSVQDKTIHHCYFSSLVARKPVFGVF